MSYKKIFDKKFVYFMWDDSLKDKEGFVAPTIRLLIDCVENGVYTNHWQKLAESHDTDLPFHSITGSDYGFSYYDPLYEVKSAWKNGEQIQSRSKIDRDAEWEDDDYPQWNNHCMEFRVRPEGFVPKKKWRPCKSVEELKQVWESKWCPLVHPELVEPLIWVRSKSNTTSTYLISSFCGNVGVVHIHNVLDTSLEQLFDDYTFLDGGVIGVAYEK